MLPVRWILLPLLVLSAVISASCAPIRPVPPEYEHSLSVTAAAYNSTRGQTDASPQLGAWGDRLTPGIKAIAISQDLASLGLRRGTKVRVEGLPGEYLVLDLMPAKWKRHIDIYMGEDVKAARAWGRRKVKIWWSDPEGSRPRSSFGWSAATSHRNVE
jgi:3D (Asp-Asp-Asp) domain-containing protein